jgi:hypothetical protein
MNQPEDMARQYVLTIRAIPFIGMVTDGNPL